MSSDRKYLYVKKALKFRQVIADYNKEKGIRLMKGHLSVLIYIEHHVNPNAKQLQQIVSWNIWAHHYKDFLLDNGFIAQHEDGKKITYTITPDGQALLQHINKKLRLTRFSRRYPF